MALPIAFPLGLASERNNNIESESIIINSNFQQYEFLIFQFNIYTERVIEKSLKLIVYNFKNSHLVAKLNFYI